MKLIPLTKGFSAMVDDADFEHLSKWKWTAMVLPNGSVCAYRKEDRRTNVYMHRQIAGARKGQTVVHADRNRLNNQRRNLKTCTRVQVNGNTRLSRRNSSGLKGVRFRANRWEASMSKGHKFVYLGRFPTRGEAAATYDAAARDYFGTFALTNQRLGAA